MPRHTTGNGQQQPDADKTALETALEKIEAIKGSYCEAIRGLNDLTDTLKQVQREHKTSERGSQSVRSTLGKLQSVKF